MKYMIPTSSKVLDNNWAYQIPFSSLHRRSFAKFERVKGEWSQIVIHLSELIPGRYRMDHPCSFDASILFDELSHDCYRSVNLREYSPGSYNSPPFRSSGLPSFHFLTSLVQLVNMAIFPDIEWLHKYRKRCRWRNIHSLNFHNSRIFDGTQQNLYSFDIFISHLAAFISFQNRTSNLLPRWHYPSFLAFSCFRKPWVFCVHGHIKHRLKSRLRMGPVSAPFQLTRNLLITCKWWIDVGYQVPQVSQDVFLGIPFAKAERFRVAESLTATWTDTRDATHFGLACVGYWANLGLG